MDETFSAFHRIFSFAGIPIYAKENWDSNIWLYLQIFNVIISILCFIFTTGFVVTNAADLLVFIDAACIWNTGVIMTISLVVCLIFRKKFRLFLSEMAFKDEMLSMPLIKYTMGVAEGKKLLTLKNLVTDTQEKLFKFTRVLLKVYAFCVWLVATLYLSSPIYEMIAKGDPSMKLLAFEMWFPWSLEKWGVYISSFIFNVYSGYLCCVAYPGLQLTIILLVGQVVRQIRILVFVMQNLDDLVVEIIKGRGEMWQFYCSAVLAECVDHYIKLKNFSNRLNVICQPFYLTLILDAIMLVCMCSVKVAISDKMALGTIKYYVHGFCFIMVVLIFCLFGQQVDTECEHLEMAITEKWYLFDKKHKMDVRLFKMALSQRMPIFIFGSIRLYLPTFTWFIKTGMSFFTLMMSVLEEIQ